MNPVLWLLAGAVTGLLALTALKLNSRLGLLVSITIGVVTAFLGGHVLAPILGTTVADVGEFNPFALLVAAATTLGFLSIADVTSKYFGF